MSSRNVTDATLWKGFATSTENADENKKKQQLESLKQSDTCQNLKRDQDTLEKISKNG